ncbi:MAG: sodium/proton-translocating pyrophosphatase, partial [Oscillospiraceae bacterium]|nr:sodium/proton-translocating pyrophosphatase [Oscillospiraceae bacterium]
MSGFVWIIPILAVCALCFAAYKASYVSKAAAGTSRMQEIASAIAEGADAFLMSEYRILAIFVVILFLLIGFFINWGTAVCFLLGAFCSILAGFFGMKVATRANVRTANAAMESGMNKALSIAFAGGSVMGMCVVGLGLLGCSLIYILTGNYNILFGFSLGASSIALFARVGGGIY